MGKFSFNFSYVQLWAKGRPGTYGQQSRNQTPCTRNCRIRSTLKKLRNGENTHPGKIKKYGGLSKIQARTPWEHQAELFERLLVMGMCWFGNANSTLLGFRSCSRNYELYLDKGWFEKN